MQTTEFLNQLRETGLPISAYFCGCSTYPRLVMQRR